MCSNGSRDTGAAGEGVPSSPFERHYSPRELAELWVLNENTIRRIFQDEPGVLKIRKIGQPDRKLGERDYVTLRIPASVVERVYRQRSR
jgi:hypothetical protein